MNALLERPQAMATGASPEAPLLLQFERQGKFLGRIPMVVRLNLDLCGLSFGLDDWVTLDLDTKIALSSRVAGTQQAARLWTRMALDCVPAARPCTIDPSELLGMDCAVPPARVNAALLAAGYAELDGAAWRGLDKLRRYALLKLSRPGHKNRSFEKVAAEVSTIF